MSYTLLYQRVSNAESHKTGNYHNPINMDDLCIFEGHIYYAWPPIALVAMGDEDSIHLV